MIFDITKIKHIRKKLNMTQNQFAKSANVSQSLIAKIESGKLDPTYTKVKQISEAIDRLSKKREAKIKEIMVKKVITVKPDDNLTKVIKLSSKHGISQVPVVEDKNVLGIIYEGTIPEKSVETPISELKIQDVISETPPIVSEDANVTILPSLLRHYPVVLVARNGVIKGIVSKVDLLQNLI